MSRPKWLPKIDLTKVTRNSDKVTTTVEVKGPDGSFYEWLRFGELSRFGSGQRFLGVYYTYGVTDTEHDSAYAIHFDVTGVKFMNVYGGNIEFEAIIAGADEDVESFKVPTGSIDSLDELEGEECEEDNDYCDLGPHIMIEYTPKQNTELWKKLRGREIRITICPVVAEEE
jgi:hypothetical protein